MFRKTLFILLALPLLVAAVNSRISFPLLLLMVGLTLVALSTPSARDEQQE